MTAATTPRWLYAAFAAAALINISPMLVNRIGADMVLYLVWIRCFAEQFWAGDIYPRWCIDVNGGSGTTVFLFYFPMAFYVGSLLYPLVALGLSYYGLFAVICWLMSFASMLTCYRLLREMVDTNYAVIASILFVFMPYHLEMTFFRGAYSEIIVMPLVPLLFLYSRRIALGGSWRDVTKLALITTAMLLTHIPVSAGAMLLSGVYFLSLSRCNVPAIRRYTIACLWGIAAALFYIAPAIYYQRYLGFTALSSGIFGWPNFYLTGKLFTIPGLWRPLGASGLGLLIFTGLAATILIKRARITDPLASRETTLWLCIGTLAFFLLFKISAPFYALFGPFAKIFFPWRMQMVAMLASTCLFALCLQWLSRPNRLKTWKTDFAILITALWCISNALVSSFSDKGYSDNDELIAAKISYASEYRTQWTDAKNWQYESLLAYSKIQHPKAEFIKGGGTLVVHSWDWRGFELEVNSKQPSVLRLNQIYFPLWEAKTYKGATAHESDFAHLYPEGHTGLMLLDIPPGEHVISVTPEITGDQPFLIAAKWLSIIAFALLTIALVRPKLFDIRRG